MIEPLQQSAVAISDTRISNPKHDRLSSRKGRCMYLVVCYDIVEDRRRNRLLRSMKGFLAHVQKSVFEGELEESRLESLRQRILAQIDPSEDTVRIYHLCGRCIPATEVLGTGVYVEEETDEVL